jgi:hypothetical protein
MTLTVTGARDELSSFVERSSGLPPGHLVNLVAGARGPSSPTAAGWTEGIEDELWISLAAQAAAQLSFAGHLPTPTGPADGGERRWRSERWGTAEDVEGLTVVAATPHALELRFGTADTPPEGWLAHVVECHPSLGFRLSFVADDGSTWVMEACAGKPLRHRRGQG